MPSTTNAGPQDNIVVSDEQQVGDVRATVERILAESELNRETQTQGISKCLIVLAEAIQRIEKTVTRKIALRIERSKVSDLW